MEKFTELCEGRYPVGLFYFDKASWSDEGVKQAVDIGADFLVATESLEPLVSLCEKYNLGIISTSNFTLWWGGMGDTAGTYKDHTPLEKLDEIKKSYPESPAVWGDYPVDEPNCKDFEHVNKVIKRYREVFPGKMPFINLHPAQAVKLRNESGGNPLGNPTYNEYVDDYVREIDTPYIAFDNYPLSNLNHDFPMYLENLDIIARACKKSNREMWVITAAGAWKPEQILDAFQIDWQIYLCLAYGAKTIIHASYSKGWWDETTSCVNLQGEKNVTYDYVKDINAVLHSPLGTEFLKYDYLYTEVCGDIESAHELIKPQFVKQNSGERPSDLPEITIESDKAVVIGYFKKDDGFAVMVVNSHDPFDGLVTANVKLEAKGTKQIKSIGSGQGVFVIFE